MPFNRTMIDTHITDTWQIFVRALEDVVLIFEHYWAHIVQQVADNRPIII